MTCIAVHLFFRNEFDKFNHTGARMLDSKIIQTAFRPENVKILPHVMQRYNRRHNVTLRNL